MTDRDFEARPNGTTARANPTEEAGASSTTSGPTRPLGRSAWKETAVCGQRHLIQTLEGSQFTHTVRAANEFGGPGHDGRGPYTPGSNVPSREGAEMVAKGSPEGSGGIGGGSTRGRTASGHGSSVVLRVVDVGVNRPPKAKPTDSSVELATALRAPATSKRRQRKRPGLGPRRGVIVSPTHDDGTERAAPCIAGGEQNPMRGGYAPRITSVSWSPWARTVRIVRGPQRVGRRGYKR